MDEHDTAAIVALLAKQVRVQEENQRYQKAIVDAQASVTANNRILSNIKAGFLVFGLDSGTKEAWDKMRDVIGTEAYNKGIAIGQGKYVTSTVIKALPSPEKGSEPVDETGDDDDEEVAFFDDDAADEQVTPNIRELVTDHLRSAGSKGAKASEIRSVIQLTHGLNMHEKTVGMTLYRLSKDNIVRRAGRMWFYVDQKQGSENVLQNSED